MKNTDIEIIVDKLRKVGQMAKEIDEAKVSAVDAVLNVGAEFDQRSVVRLINHSLDLYLEDMKRYHAVVVGKSPLLEAFSGNTSD